MNESPLIFEQIRDGIGNDESSASEGAFSCLKVTKLIFSRSGEQGLENQNSLAPGGALADIAVTPWRIDPHPKSSIVLNLGGIHR